MSFQDKQKSKFEDGATQRGRDSGIKSASINIQNLSKKISQGLFNSVSSINARINTIEKEKKDIRAANRPATNIKDKSAQAAFNRQTKAAIDQIILGLDEEKRILEERRSFVQEESELRQPAIAKPTLRFGTLPEKQSDIATTTQSTGSNTLRNVAIIGIVGGLALG